MARHNEKEAGHVCAIGPVTARIAQALHVLQLCSRADRY
jgi:hypothetical protein